MPSRKELHFFDREYESGIASYSAHFPDRDRAVVVGEATSSYFSCEGVAKRIHEHLPDVKMIVILRHPVDRLVSRYLNIRSAHYPTNRHLTVFDKIDAKPEIMAEGLYYTHLSTYFGLFDREQLLVTMFSRLRDEPVEFLREVYSFLGISDDHTPRMVDSRVNSALSKPNVGRSALVYYLAVAARRLRLQSVSDVMLSAIASDEVFLSEAERQRIFDKYYRRELHMLETEYGITVST